jgi:putative FmdB family regulatory protein
MPFFDYKCNSCGTVSEVMVKSADSAVLCPVCGSATERQLSAPAGFKFKGGGFYANEKAVVNPNDSGDSKLDVKNYKSEKIIVGA